MDYFPELNFTDGLLITVVIVNDQNTPQGTLTHKGFKIAVSSLIFHESAAFSVGQALDLHLHNIAPGFPVGHSCRHMDMISKGRFCNGHIAKCQTGNRVGFQGMIDRPLAGRRWLHSEQKAIQPAAPRCCLPPERIPGISLPDWRQKPFC